MYCVKMQSKPQNMTTNFDFLFKDGSIIHANPEIIDFVIVCLFMSGIE